MPAVNIVVPVYNAVDYLSEAIESALSQTYADWELLIVDDGSTDGSVEVATQYVKKDSDRIRLLIHPGHENRGVSATRNLAIESASAEYIAFLDADDVWLPHRLERSMEALTRHPEVGLSFGRAICVDEKTQRIDQPTGLFGFAGELGAGMPGQPFLGYEGFLDQDWYAPVSTVTVRRRLVLEVGGFSLHLKHHGGEDQIMWAKLAKRAPLHFLGEPLALYRIHGSNWTSRQNSLSALETQLEFLTRLVDDFREMDGAMAEAIVQFIHRYWNAKMLPLSRRLKGIGQVLRLLHAHGKARAVVPRYLVRRFRRWVRLKLAPTKREAR